MKTTMWIDKEILDWLGSMKHRGDSYNDVLKRMKGEDDGSKLDALKEKMVNDAQNRIKANYREKLKNDLAASRKRVNDSVPAKDIHKAYMKKIYDKDKDE